MDLTGFIAENLFSVHAFLASLSGNEIFRIEQGEADKLGEAIQGVARHYDIPGVNQVAVDWVRLARTLGMVYGGRMFAAKMMARSNAAKPVQPTQTMTASPPPGTPAAQQGNGQVPPSQRARDGGTWASPGPGLPPIFVPDPSPNG